MQAELLEESVVKKIPNYLVIRDAFLRGEEIPVTDTGKKWSFSYAELVIMNTVIIMMRNEMSEMETRIGGKALEGLVRRRKELEWLNMKIYKYIKMESVTQKFTKDEQVLLYETVNNAEDQFNSIEKKLYDSFITKIGSEEGCIAENEHIVKQCMKMGIDKVIKNLTQNEMWKVHNAISEVRKTLERAYGSLTGIAAETIMEKMEELGEMDMELTYHLGSK